MCADPYVKVDAKLLAEEEVLARSDLIVIGAPHQRYAQLTINQPVVDIWGARGNGVMV